MIIGGNFDQTGGKPSSIVAQLSSELNVPSLNGGTFIQLATHQNLTEELNIWMPNISNDIQKIYPIKNTGSTLICSKVLREGRFISDAVARIFMMHANAVIAIKPNTPLPGRFTFVLVDALGNVWVETRSINILAQRILDFHNWSRSMQRARSIHCGELDLESNSLDELCKINSKLADRVENCSVQEALSTQGVRYFGNCSTRCASLFPSIKTETQIFVSKRNIDKRRLTPEDMVQAFLNGEAVNYRSQKNDKPSVDTPIQLHLYTKLPAINCMIHGHAYVKNAPYTDEYFPCGDLREIDSTLKVLKNQTMCINLKNHGFLAVGKSLKELEEMLDVVDMVPKVPGKEKITE